MSPPSALSAAPAPDAPSGQRWRRGDIVRSILFCAIGIGCLVLAVQGIDWPVVWEQLRGVNLGWVALAFGCSFLNLQLKAVRWRLILAPTSQIAYGPVLRAIVIGQFLNTVLPLRAGELARVYFARSIPQVSAGLSVGSIALEKLMDSAALVAVAALALWVAPLPPELRVSGIWIAAALTALLILVAVLVAVGPIRQRLLRLGSRMFTMFEAIGLPANATAFVRRQTEGMIASLDVYRHPKATAWLVAWTVVIWGTGALTNWLAIQALDLPVSWAAAVTILVLLMAGSSVPGLPGRFGSFQLFTLVAVIPFGVSQESGLALGVLLHLIVFLPIWGLGALFMLTGGQHRSAETAMPRGVTG